MENMKKKKCNIGVIIGNLEAPHAYDLMRGISQAAEDYDANLFVFPGMHSKSFYDKSLLEHREKFDYQFNTVYDYVLKEQIDILIISLGTVIDFLGTDDYQEFLNKFKKIPQIILEDVIEDETCITLDNRVGLYECIKHLIVDHGYKKIAFVSGRRNNYDAKERLDVYCKIMKEYHLPIEEGMIAYGDFTEYSDEQVANILERHPDTEAICFASDMMTLGGYRECKKRGKVVGKDIAITGFDDNQQAISSDPPLTTVRVRPFVLGYHAVNTALDKFAGKKVFAQTMKSTLSIRNSCGCKANMSKQIQIEFAGKNKEELIEQHTSYILNEITNHPDGKIVQHRLDCKIRELVTLLLESYLQGEPLGRHDEVVDKIKELLQREYESYYSVQRFKLIMFQFVQSLIQHTENQTLQKEFAKVSASIFVTISTYIQTQHQRMVKRGKKESWYASYVTRDTMVYSTDEREALYQIMNKMRLLHFKSAHIYLFKEPVKNYDNRYWICPEKMYLAAKEDGNECIAYETADRPFITLAEGMQSETDSGERYMAMHFSLFSNETQYGLLMCEASLEEASFAYSISLQIGTAMKFLEMMREQMNMQKRLRDSVEMISKKNDLLNHLSISDELTGLLNRRGIFEAMLDKLLENPGKLVAVVFIDMDNLKQVNDTFGHNEGDFALKSIAKILKESFRQQDPIGRIGGDEFLAYMVIDEPNLVHRIRCNIETLTKELNTYCEKPYYVEMSVGVKEVIAHTSMDLKDILKEADNVLYEDKRNKRKSCFKNAM